MKIRFFLSVAILLTSSVSNADIVVDWNQRANSAMIAEGPMVANSGLGTSRTLAMMHVAMFDAINASGATYQSYLSGFPLAQGASAQASAHAAARAVLVDQFPKQRTTIEAGYIQAMAALPEGSAKSSGIVSGEKAAQLVLASRKGDGHVGSPDTYRPATSAGVYVPTALPVVSNVALRTTFALKNVSQFRPGPPPSLDSKLWARDYNETMELGSAASSKRNAWQAETARFWIQVGTPAWNQAARSLTISRPMPLLESARLFAHLNMAIFDAYLAVFDAKYTFNFWRPITAIRNGDIDGNDATQRDPGWTPLIETPLHPEYPCAHCTVDGAAGAVLKSVFGRGAVPLFKLDSATASGVVREYSSIQQLEDEVSMARIWGGLHYRNSNEIGHELGEKVGEYVLNSTLGH